MRDFVAPDFRHGLGRCGGWQVHSFLVKTVRIGILLSVASALAFAHAQDLNVGHLAPSIDVARWVKGDTVRRFEKGHVYVVEFWATWCGPCKRSIPHLTELAHKYAGKVTFIGVDVYDQSPTPTDLSYIKKVKAFVDAQKGAMDYRVAVDGPKNAMAQNWLKAFGEGGIPTAFVVDGAGHVAWIGGPMDGLDEAIGEVLSPGYDLATAAAAHLQAKKEAEAQLPLSERFFHEMQWKHWSTARDLSDQLLASDPGSEKTYAGARFIVLLHTDTGDAYDYARKLSAGIYKGFAPALTGLARAIAQEPGIENPDLDLALSLAQQSVDASAGKDPRYLETLAIVRGCRGENAKAAAAMETAIRVGEASKDTPPTLLKEMRDRLASYRSK